MWVSMLTQIYVTQTHLVSERKRKAVLMTQVEEMKLLRVRMAQWLWVHLRCSQKVRPAKQQGWRMTVHLD